MKTTSTKIAILITAIVSVVIAVLFFIKTIVSPPVALPVENLHIESLETAISQFRTTKSSDSLYNAVTNKIYLFHKEGYISDEQKDNTTYSFVQAYLPLFKNETYNKFSASVWKESDHKAILSRIKDLRSLKIAYGNQPAVTGQDNTDLSNIEQIIENYNDAKAAAKKSKFSSIDQAKKDITAANSYAVMPYISNCRDLVARLNNVKENIGNSHYQYLVSNVNSLAGCYSYTRATYKVLVGEVDAKIKSYENTKSIYGASAKGTSELRSNAAAYVREANKYFDSLEKPTITVNTNGYSWYSMTSPSIDYNAYYSYSNYHKHSTDAQMSFTFKGYSSFTFYIRSNAEGSCDYVMVGALDTRPTKSNNYANTAGKQNSGTAFYNYTAVTYNNLEKSRSYTVYVTYTKDFSENRGEDRGYILIPKVK